MGTMIIGPKITVLGQNAICCLQHLHVYTATPRQGGILLVDHIAVRVGARVWQ